MPNFWKVIAVIAIVIVIIGIIGGIVVLTKIN